MTAVSAFSGRCILKNKTGILVFFLLLTTAAGLAGQDYFRFYAPPGGVYLNASFERDETVILPVTVEHLGTAVSQWFMTVSAGDSGVYSQRETSQGSYTLIYNITKQAPPSSQILNAPPDALTSDNVITTSDFGTLAGSVERVSFDLYYYLESGQFSASGEYNDSLTISLYQGDYADSGTHVLADSFTIQVVARMAELIDLYADREPDNRYLDLTRDLSTKLIATVHERSNSPLGYEVTVTSRNLANDGSATVPFFIHESDADRLDYSLVYDGSAVGTWIGGTSLITDSSGITSPEWLHKDLTISYTGDPDLAFGSYEDILTITITSK